MPKRYVKIIRERGKQPRVVQVSGKPISRASGSRSSSPQELRERLQAGERVILPSGVDINQRRRLVRQLEFERYGTTGEISGAELRQLESEANTRLTVQKEQQQKVLQPETTIKETPKTTKQDEYVKAFTAPFQRDLTQREIEKEEFRQAVKKGAPVPFATFTPIGIQRTVGQIQRKKTLAAREERLTKLKQERETLETKQKADTISNQEVEGFNKRLGRFKGDFARISKVEESRQKEQERQFKQLEEIENKLKGDDLTLKQQTGLKKVQKEGIANFAAFTGQKVPESSKVGKVVQNVGTNIGIVEQRFKESRGGKTYQKVIGTPVRRAGEFAETEAFIRDRELKLKQDELIKQRQAIQDGTKKAFFLDQKIQDLETKRGFVRFRANFLGGVTETVEKKPVKLAGIAALGAGVRAATQVGGAAVGGSKVAGGLGKGLAGGLGIVYTRGVLEELASYKDETKRQKKIGEEATEVTAFLGGAAAFKKTDTAIRGFNKPKIQKIGIKTETTQVATDKQALDLSKSELKFTVKARGGKAKEITGVAYGAERTKPLSPDSDLLVSRGEQVVKIGKITAKGKTASFSRTQDDVINTLRLSKFKTSKGQFIRTLQGQKSKIVQKEPTETTLELLQTLTTKRKITKAKPTDIGIGTTKETLRVQKRVGDQPTTFRKFKQGAIITQDSKVVKDFQSKFKGAKPIKVKPGGVKSTETGTDLRSKILTRQKLQAVTQQRGIEAAQVGKTIIKSQYKTKQVKTPKLKTIFKTRGATKVRTKQTSVTALKLSTTQKTEQIPAKLQAPAITGTVILEEQKKSGETKPLQKTTPIITTETTTRTKLVNQLIGNPAKPPSSQITTIPEPPPPLLVLGSLTLPSGGVLGGGSRKKKKKARQPKRITPSLRANLLGIRGTPTKTAIKTGIGLRPIPVTIKKKKLRKR